MDIMEFSEAESNVQDLMCVNVPILCFFVADETILSEPSTNR